MTDFPQLEGFKGGAGLIRLIGHRGARGIMPENTMEGFQFTLKIGVRALEFDVVLTRDQIPVITHNIRLLNAATRRADGGWLIGDQAKISQLTFADLENLDVGGLDDRTIYGQRFPDQVFLSDVRIPRLTDLLDLALEPEGKELLLLLEMKTDMDCDDAQGAREKAARQVIADIRSRGLERRTVLHSFDWVLLEFCRSIAPDIPRSYLSQNPHNHDDPGEDSAKAVAPNFTALEASVPQAVADAGGKMWCPYFQDVTPDLVTEAHALGLIVAAWTANAPQEIHQMIDAGVDGIVTDYPGRAQRILRTRGLNWT